MSSKVPDLPPAPRHLLAAPGKTGRGSLGLRLALALAVAGLLGSCLDLSEPDYGIGGGSAPLGEGLRCGTAFQPGPDDLLLHFIDAGQGDAIWIQTPDDGNPDNGTQEGYNILIDTGHLALEDAPGTGPVVIDYLTAHGLPPGGRIDYMIITHAHADHYGGAIPILESYDVVNVLDPGFDNNENSTYEDFLQRAQSEVNELGGRLFRPLVGSLVDAEYDQSDLFGDEIALTVLNSESQLRLGTERDDQINNTSISLALEFAGVSILLMGDSYQAVETEILQALPDLRANILKVGHHGSLSSTGDAWLQAIFADIPVTRRFAVIESGRRTFGGGTTLPAAETVARIQAVVPAQSFFSTQFDDQAKTEAEAPGDDNVQALVRADGDISVCYVP